MAAAGEAGVAYFGGTEDDTFGVTFTIPEAPLDQGPMSIVIGGNYNFETDIWEGTFTATLGSGSGFAGAEYAGEWSGQVVPAPTGIALLGIAGLARRRRN